MDFGLTAVVAITVICYLLGQGVKLTQLPNQWVPVLCGVCGGLLGVLGFYTTPSYPAEELLTAVAVGIQSGLAATGAHQAMCQLQRTKETTGSPPETGVPEESVTEPPAAEPSAQTEKGEVPAASKEEAT